MISATRTLIRQAVPAGALPIFQPIFMVGDRSHNQPMWMVEALGRLSLSNGQILPPNKFLPALKGTSAAEEFDRVILDRSLAQVARWQCGIRHDVHVHVNAGQPTLRNPTYGRYLQSRLDRYKTDPALLTIEVVEGDSFWLDPAILLTLKSLTSQGVRLAIDDFPKWKSPRQLIAWLRTAERHQIQITHLKIDRSVIVKVCKSDEKTVLKIKEYLQLALELGIQVIAEGIENEDDARTMIGYGVDGLQGYGIQKPANAEVMETYFSSLYQPAAAGKTQRSVMTSH